MKVTINVTSNELLYIKARLLVRDGLVKCDFNEYTVENEILRRVYEAAQETKNEEE